MKYLIITILIFLASCTTNPPAQGLQFKFGNDCLPQAIVMVEGLRSKNIEADVLILKTPIWAHAISVYFYPKGQNRMWGWDHFNQSVRIRAFRDDPKAVATDWLKKTHQKNTTVEFAEYLK